MRSTIQMAWATAFLAAALASAALAAAPPGTVRAGTAPPPVISSQQIDRFDAIQSLQDKVKDNPKSLVDWVILGELTHEVALDLPAEEAAKYNQLSLDAYQKALALAPDNPGLKAAVQFARDQQSGQARFEKSRDQVTEAYLDARRRDLQANGYTPSVRVASPPLPSQTTPPATGAVIEQPATATAPVAVGAAPAATTLPAYSFSPPYMYQPLYTPTATAPYTYSQYTSAYYPPNYYAPGIQAISAPRYMQQGLLRAAGRAVLGR